MGSRMVGLPLKDEVSARLREVVYSLWELGSCVRGCASRDKEASGIKHQSTEDPEGTNFPPVHDYAAGI